MARAVAGGTSIDAGLLGASIAVALAALALPARMKDPITQVLRRDCVAPLIRLQQNAELGRAAITHRTADVALRDSTAMQALLVPGLEAENTKLRGLLGLGKKLGWGYVPADAMRSRALGEEFTLILTAGSLAGVRQFSPVVAPEGIVGMVETVDPSMSLAILWPHPDFRVSAMTADGNTYGIVKPHMGSGMERYLLELSGVQLAANLPAGTPIISSGLGGTFPRGIPVGTVMRELKTSESWSRTFLLNPVVHPSDFSAVLILEPKRVAAGVQSVWESGGGAPPPTDSTEHGQSP
jgi:rod shape-determining protein MreC